MRKHRKGLMVMEKPITAKYRTQFWYIALASSLLWILLLYLFNSSAITVHNEERLFREEENSFAVSVHESDSISHPADESSDENNNNNNTSRTLPVSDDSVRDQPEDVRIINDIVEELEKEKENEKKSVHSDHDGDSFLGKQTRLENEEGMFDTDLAVKGRNSRRTRSWDRLFSKRTNNQNSSNKERESADDDSFLEKQTGMGSEDKMYDKDLAAKKFEELPKTQPLDRTFTKKNNNQVLSNKETATRKKKEDELESEIDRVTGTKNDIELRKDESKNRVRVSAENKNEESSNKEVMATNRNEKTTRPFGRRRQQPADLSKPSEKKIQKVMVRPRKTNPNDPCTGKYVYIHEIPTLFNDELLKNCWSLSWWTDMCELTSNLGLGPRLPDMERVSGWFATNQFTLEVIFHNRMKQYKCLTKDSSMASAIFVPYYAGLDVMRYLWGPFPYMRDAAALDLMKWLREKPEWKRMSGRDHFMVAGRTTWDFMRTPENESDWGNRLMILPEPRNMTMLLIESSPWNYHGFAIPYATYFHPSSNNEILQWQNRMRRIKRRYMFSFVGAPRPNLGDNIRGEIMDQCRASRRKCKLLECVSGSNKCYKPDQIMKFFLSSTFCLQPPGDSYTRRSTFDSILAGCIPVFFHPGSAYAQYIWHLPKDISTYSVFIPVQEVKEAKVSIERVLNRIPRAKVVAMREEVIKLIPKLMYTNPSSKLERTEDAFDLTIKGVLERVEGLRNRIEEGKEMELFDFPEEFSWKYNMLGNVELHGWDSYFERP